MSMFTTRAGVDLYDKGWGSGPDRPRLAQLIGGVFVAYLGLMVWQGLRIRRERRRSPGTRLAERAQHGGG
ncbi:hypothetical protein [Lysobacter capsici]|uniref:hypothetical protein n=1 Tax=Lysobacter capsici TaxID=435897 RepID=UPI001C001504|nr:hypothetical protein [Lysobacter capsici]QWF16267.1 hypothetical protein KME82_21325 [Lysobacter capsici]